MSHLSHDALDVIQSIIHVGPPQSNDDFYDVDPLLHQEAPVVFGNCLIDVVSTLSYRQRMSKFSLRARRWGRNSCALQTHFALKALGLRVRVFCCPGHCYRPITTFVIGSARGLDIGQILWHQQHVTLLTSSVPSFLCRHTSYGRVAPFFHPRGLSPRTKQTASSCYEVSDEEPDTDVFEVPDIDFPSSQSSISSIGTSGTDLPCRPEGPRVTRSRQSSKVSNTPLFQEECAGLQTTVPRDESEASCRTSRTACESQIPPPPPPNPFVCERPSPAQSVKDSLVISSQNPGKGRRRVSNGPANGPNSKPDSVVSNSPNVKRRCQALVGRQHGKVQCSKFARVDLESCFCGLHISKRPSGQLQPGVPAYDHTLCHARVWDPTYEGGRQCSRSSSTPTIFCVQHATLKARVHGEILKDLDPECADKMRKAFLKAQKQTVFEYYSRHRLFHEAQLLGKEPADLTDDEFHRSLVRINRYFQSHPSLVLSFQLRSCRGPQCVEDRHDIDKVNYIGGLKLWKYFWRPVFDHELKLMCPNDPSALDHISEAQFYELLRLTNQRVWNLAIIRNHIIPFAGPQCFHHKDDPVRMHAAPDIEVASNPSLDVPYKWMQCSQASCQRWHRVDHDTARLYDDERWIRKSVDRIVAHCQEINPRLRDGMWYWLRHRSADSDNPIFHDTFDPVMDGCHQHCDCLHSFLVQSNSFKLVFDEDRTFWSVLTIFREICEGSSTPFPSSLLVRLNRYRPETLFFQCSDLVQCNCESTDTFPSMGETAIQLDSGSPIIILSPESDLPRFGSIVFLPEHLHRCVVCHSFEDVRDLKLGEHGLDTHCCFACRMAALSEINELPELLKPNRRSINGDAVMAWKSSFVQSRRTLLSVSDDVKWHTPERFVASLEQGDTLMFELESERRTCRLVEGSPEELHRGQEGWRVLPMEASPLRTAKLQARLHREGLEAVAHFSSIMNSLVLFHCRECKIRFPTFHPKHVPPFPLQATQKCPISVGCWDQEEVELNYKLAPTCQGLCSECHHDLSFSKSKDGDGLPPRFGSQNRQDPLCGFPRDEMTSAQLALGELYRQATLVESMLVALNHIQVSVSEFSPYGRAVSRFHKNVICFPQRLADLRSHSIFTCRLKINDIVQLTPGSKSMDNFPPCCKANFVNLSYRVDAFKGCDIRLKCPCSCPAFFDVPVKNIRSQTRLPWRPCDLSHALIVVRRRKYRTNEVIEDLKVRRNFVRAILENLTKLGPYHKTRPEDPDSTMHFYYSEIGQWDEDVITQLPEHDVPKDLHIQDLDGQRDDENIDEGIFQTWMIEGRHDCEIANALLSLWITAWRQHDAETHFDLYAKIRNYIKEEEAEREDSESMLTNGNLNPLCIAYLLEQLDRIPETLKRADFHDQRDTLLSQILFELDAVRSYVDAWGSTATMSSIAPPSIGECVGQEKGFDSIMWPSISETPAKFDEIGKFVKSFPLEFPMGLGDYYQSHLRSDFNMRDWLQHKIRYYDGRFVSSNRAHRIIWAMFNQALMDDASRASAIFHKASDSQALTKRELKKITEDRSSILRNLTAYGAPIETSPMFWRKQGVELETIVRHMSWKPSWVVENEPENVEAEVSEPRTSSSFKPAKNLGLGRIPAIWFTLNCPYNYLHCIHRFNFALTPDMSPEDERQCRVKFCLDNPDIVAMIHVVRVELLIRIVMASIVPNSPAEPFLYWARFEEGTSGNPHAHGLVYASGNPSIDVATITESEKPVTNLVCGDNFDPCVREQLTDSKIDVDTECLKKLYDYFCELTCEQHPAMNEEGKFRDSDWVTPKLDKNPGGRVHFLIEGLPALGKLSSPETVNLTELLDQCFHKNDSGLHADDVNLQPLRELLFRLVESSQRHTHHGLGAPSAKMPCARKVQNTTRCWTCRYNFPKRTLTHSDVRDGRLSKDPHKAGMLNLLVDRNDPLINAYEAHLLLANLGNVDFRPLVNLWSVLEYLTKYASKGLKTSKSLSHLFDDVLQKVCTFDLDGKDLWKRTISKFYNQTLGSRDYTLFEVTRSALKLPPIISSFPKPDKKSIGDWSRVKTGQALSSAKDSDKVTSRTAMGAFNARFSMDLAKNVKPKDLESISFYQFWRVFNVSHDRISRRRFDPIIHLTGVGFASHGNANHPNHENYCRGILRAYLPCLQKSGSEYVENLVASQFDNRYQDALRYFIVHGATSWLPTHVLKNYMAVNDITQPMNSDGVFVDPKMGKKKAADNDDQTKPRRNKTNTIIFDDDVVVSDHEVEPKHDGPIRIDPWSASLRTSGQLASEAGPHVPWIDNIDDELKVLYPNVNLPDQNWTQNSSQLSLKDVDRSLSMFEKLRSDKNKSHCSSTPEPVNLDKLSPYQKLFVDLVLRHARELIDWKTSKGRVPKPAPLKMILLGTAGTGKTTCVHALLQELQTLLKQHRISSEFFKVGAPTGCAAFNMKFGATTLHSLFKIRVGRPFAEFDPNDPKLAEKQADMLDTQLYIFDEFSMIGRSMLGCIDSRARQFSLDGQDQDLGGKSAIFVGDPAQCPPIQDQALYNPLSHPRTVSEADNGRVKRSNRGLQVFRDFTDVIILDQIQRVSDSAEDKKDDKDRFRQLQLHLRDCSWSDAEYHWLTSRTHGLLSSKEQTKFADAVTLMEFRKKQKSNPSDEIQSNETTVAQAEKEDKNCESFNRNRLYRFAKDRNLPVAAIASYDWSTVSSDVTEFEHAKFSGLEHIVELCVGARVLLTFNLWTEAGLVNGSNGIVREIIYRDGYGPHSKKENGLPLAVVVEFDAYSGPPIFEGNDRQKWVPLKPVEICCEEDAKVKRSQLPLTLAYAITVWKAQGMTLDRVYLELADCVSRPGVAFVALTRVRSINHLCLSDSFPGKDVFDRQQKSQIYKDRIQFEKLAIRYFVQTLKKYGTSEHGFLGPFRWTESLLFVASRFEGYLMDCETCPSVENQRDYLLESFNITEKETDEMIALYDSFPYNKYVELYRTSLNADAAPSTPPRKRKSTMNDGTPRVRSCLEPISPFKIDRKPAVSSSNCPREAPTTPPRKRKNTSLDGNCSKRFRSETLSPVKTARTCAKPCQEGLYFERQVENLCGMHVINHLIGRQDLTLSTLTDFVKQFASTVCSITQTDLDDHVDADGGNLSFDMIAFIFKQLTGNEIDPNQKRASEWLRSDMSSTAILINKYVNGLRHWICIKCISGHLYCFDSLDSGPRMISETQYMTLIQKPDVNSSFVVQLR